MKICPKCHHKNNSTNAFCEECGYDLKDVKVQSKNKFERSRGSKNSKGAKNSLIKRAVFMSAGLLIIIGGIFYCRKVGKDNQINEIIDAVQSDHSNQIALKMVSDNPSLKITNQSVEPFVEYIKKHPRYTDTMKADLQQTGYTSDRVFKLKIVKNNWLILPVYKLQAKTMRPEISTNVSNAAIKANGNILATTKDDNYVYNSGTLFPGSYEFKLEGSQSSASQKVDLMDANDINKSISLLAKTPDDSQENSDETSNDSSKATDDSSNNNSTHTGSEYKDLSTPAQNAVALIEEKTDKYTDDYTYTESEPSPDVYELKLYDKDDNQYVSTYRYDNIHNILAEYNESTGKYEEVD